MGSCNTKTDLTVHKYHTEKLEKEKQDVKTQVKDIDLKILDIQKKFNNEYNLKKIKSN